MKYIVFEGIDGSGKSVQADHCCNWLTELAWTPIRLCEPSFGKYGLEIRERLMRREPLTRDEQVELFTLDREDHVKRKVRPLLEFVAANPNFVIVQDRYYLSAPAYQAYSTTEMYQLLKQQQSIAPKPDLVLLLDISAASAIRRLTTSRESRSIFEDVRVLERVRQNYLFLAREGSEPVEIVDADRYVTEVQSTVSALLRGGLEGYGSA